MLNILKWVWHKAEQKGRDQVLNDLRNLEQYHQLKAQISNLRDKIEPPDIRDSTFGNFRRMTALEHNSIAKELHDILKAFGGKTNGR